MSILRSSSSLMMKLGQNTPMIFCRYLFWKVSSLWMIRATPCRCWLSFLLYHSMVSPVANCCFPAPRRLILYWCISWRICTSLLILYSVLTFQHPMLVIVLGIRRSAFGVKTSLWVWSPSFINPVACSLLLSPTTWCSFLSFQFP